MKVAQLLYSGLGGHGSVVFSLIDTSDQWQNVLGFLGVEPVLESYGLRCAEAEIPYRYFAATAGKPWAQWRAIYRWLEAERPEAVVSHSGTALPPCILYTKRRRVPLVFVEHTPLATKSRAEWFASRVAMIAADRVVMLTAAYLHESRRRLGRWFRPGKVAVIPNGIDTEVFTPRQTARAAGRRKRIGMAARFSSAKRQDMLVAVLDELRRRRPDLHWQLTLPGDGDELLRVVRLAETLPEGLVEFPGTLEGAELVSWFRSLDLYVHASDGETLSTSLLQAMSCGLPIVASDVAGNRDLLSDRTAVLVANADLPAWTEAIESLCDGPAPALGASARALCEERYSAREMSRRYDDLLNSAVR